MGLKVGADKRHILISKLRPTPCFSKATVIEVGVTEAVKGGYLLSLNSPRKRLLCLFDILRSTYRVFEGRLRPHPSLYTYQEFQSWSLKMSPLSICSASSSVYTASFFMALS